MNDQNNIQILVDFLPAFQLADEDLHMEHEAKDALIVAKRCTSCRNCCKWRVSYGIKEANTILSGISQCHKKSYQVIKYIIQYFHFYGIDISSYHAKYVYLNHFKNCGNTGDNYAPCISDILLNLASAYRTGNLSGFVTETNLIQTNVLAFALELELIDKMFNELETEFQIDGTDVAILLRTLIGRLQKNLFVF